jgi:hypothetical protein
MKLINSADSFIFFPYWLNPSISGRRRYRIRENTTKIGMRETKEGAHFYSESQAPSISLFVPQSDRADELFEAGIVGTIGQTPFSVSKQRTGDSFFERRVQIRCGEQQWYWERVGRLPSAKKFCRADGSVIAVANNRHVRVHTGVMALEQALIAITHASDLFGECYSKTASKHWKYFELHKRTGFVKMPFKIVFAILASIPGTF